MRIKRRHSRSVTRNWNLRYKSGGTAGESDGYMTGSLVNVGRGGICFESDRELAMGSDLDVELSSGGFPAPMLAKGRVVWCRRSKVTTKFEVGVEFSGTSWDAQTQGEAPA